MSEIRKHYFLDEYCIIAPGRSKRPSVFKEEKKEGFSERCVFCAGEEDKTPLATAVYKDGMILKDEEGSRITGWDVRCIPNLYPALSPAAVGVSSEFDVSPGFGYHEVIVETPSHEKVIPDLSDTDMSLLMKVYRDRVVHYEGQDKIEYVSLFKNWGEKAGASLAHTHSQLIALPMRPPLLAEEMKMIGSLQKCPYCDLIEKESKSERLLYENEHFIVITPYCSKVPYEMWILPRMHVHHISGFDDEQLDSLGRAIHSALSGLWEYIGEIPYNYMFYQLRDEPGYHFNLKVQPVTSKAAGFEKNTGVYINTMPPETAAKYLQGIFEDNSE
ncbi:galactose-1-phosphate uridylyltransferase [Methanococcoides sp. FTZ1]|uniref:galactose-1-phosphate uridylyltransferase n=1 Tax=Methanococcoides sp. FTZ1 TaxID=3439061 RepID=UPI003F875640